MATNNLINAPIPFSVSKGGTGNNSVTAYMPLCGGISTTSPLQSISTSGASAGYVLTYVSAGSLPTWQLNAGGATSAVIQIMNFGDTTYTPTTGMIFCIMEAIGGGGGGGGSAAASAGQVQSAGGGGAGGYARAIFTAAQIGVSIGVTVGVGGAGGNNTGTDGGNGGGTSVTGLGLSVEGGLGGVGGPAGLGGNGGHVLSGDMGITGAIGGGGTLSSIVTAIGAIAGMGAPGPYGGGNPMSISNASKTGISAVMYGCGGDGAIASSASGRPGGNGYSGGIIITEFIG